MRATNNRVEPIYTFVKGKGWVIRNPVRCRPNDKLYYVEIREPTPGEMCCWVEQSEVWDQERWEFWVECSQPYTYDYLYPIYKTRTNIQWVTFIEVNQ